MLAAAYLREAPPIRLVNTIFITLLKYLTIEYKSIWTFYRGQLGRTQNHNYILSYIYIYNNIFLPVKYEVP